MLNVKVRLADADPAAFLMVLDYIYTDQIDPTRGHREKHASNEVVLSMMQVQLKLEIVQPIVPRSVNF